MPDGEIADVVLRVRTDKTEFERGLREVNRDIKDLADGEVEGEKKKQKAHKKTADGVAGLKKGYLALSAAAGIGTAIGALTSGPVAKSQLALTSKLFGLAMDNIYRDVGGENFIDAFNTFLGNVASGKQNEPKSPDQDPSLDVQDDLDRLTDPLKMPEGGWREASSNPGWDDPLGKLWQELTKPLRIPEGGFRAQSPAPQTLTLDVRGADRSLGRHLNDAFNRYASSLPLGSTFL